MFDQLSNALQRVFRDLRGYGKLSEKNMSEGLREVRLALLEADVHFKVAKDFVARIRERCLGEDVLESVTPGQQVVKRVHEELVRLLGGERATFDVRARPAQVMLLGLHGAGKTTTAGKLARQWAAEGQRVLLAACDTRRPAAVEQLAVLADSAGAGLVRPRPGEAPPEIARRAAEEAAEGDFDRILYDTGGRFQIDGEMVEEAAAIRRAVKPANVVLVLDAATGQEAVSVASAFHERIGLTGLILTKLDGDARGGAALSVQAVTGCRVLMTGAGERLEDLEPFYPDRMASRILGMGDVVSLVEKAGQMIQEGEAKRLEQRLASRRFDLEDFLSQLQQLERMGPVEQLLDMLPDAGRVPPAARRAMTSLSGREIKRAEAILRSMTPLERRRPELLDARRRRRIALGSGTRVSEVNTLLKRFDTARTMARQMQKAQKRLQGFTF